jgi:hypothetical protein
MIWKPTGKAKKEIDEEKAQKKAREFYVIIRVGAAGIRGIGGIGNIF